MLGRVSRGERTVGQAVRLTDEDDELVDLRLGELGNDLPSVGEGS